jgi:hypothetical protein
VETRPSHLWKKPSPRVTCVERRQKKGSKGKSLPSFYKNKRLRAQKKESEQKSLPQGGKQMKELACHTRMEKVPSSASGARKRATRFDTRLAGMDDTFWTPAWPEWMRRASLQSSGQKVWIAILDASLPNDDRETSIMFVLGAHKIATTTDDKFWTSDWPEWMRRPGL